MYGQLDARAGGDRGSVLADGGDQAFLVQGLGAGGLATLTYTIIGDIVPARERGRYQGYLGAVWAVAAVVAFAPWWAR